jgi:twinfilin-like protein
MLYASSRASLTKGLGPTYFTDTLYANSKADLQPGAYAAHLKQAAAPPPLSDREKEAAAAREAEKQASAAYGGSSARASPLSAAGKGLGWGEGVEDAIRALGDTVEPTLVVLSIDVPTETIVLVSSAPCVPADLSRTLPSSSPCESDFWSLATTDTFISICLLCAPRAEHWADRYARSSLASMLC